MNDTSDETAEGSGLDINPEPFASNFVVLTVDVNFSPDNARQVVLMKDE